MARERRGGLRDSALSERKATRQDEAAAWFAAQRAGVMLVEQREAFNVWLSDPRNQAAYDAMQELWEDLAVLKGERPAPRRAVPWRAMAASVVGLIALGGAGMGWMAVSGEPTVETAIGQQRTQSLPDGSLLAVNVASSVSYRFNDTSRIVKVANGEAAFAVKADAGRPFIVRAGDYEIRAIGTAFNVRERGGEIEVAVSEGEVAICSSTGTVLSTLAAGQLLRFPAESSGVDFDALTPQVIAPAQVSEWRMRVVTYENATVRDVIADFNRYFSQKLQVEGEALLDRRVTVRLQVEQREAAVQLLAALLEVEISRTAQGEALVDK
jgi:transmembrane sensor